MKLGRDIGSGKSYALKIFFTDDFNDMAETEIEALAHLSHPNIVGIHEYDQGLLDHPRRDP